MTPLLLDCDVHLPLGQPVCRLGEKATELELLSGTVHCAGVASQRSCMVSPLFHLCCYKPRYVENILHQELLERAAGKNSSVFFWLFTLPLWEAHDKFSAPTPGLTI